MQALRNPHDVLGDVSSALDAAGQVTLRGLDRAQMGAWVCELQEAKARLNALAVLAAAEAENASVQLLDNLPSVGGYVGLHTNASPKAVTYDKIMGHWLGRYSDFADAAVAGVLTPQHLRALKDCENYRTRDALFDSQETLIDAARDCSWKDFTDVLRYWMLTHDPDGQEPKAQRDDNKLNFSKGIDGRLKVNINLDPISGQEFTTAVAERSRQLRQQDLNNTDNGETRTTAQRDTAALMDLLRQGHTNIGGDTAKPLVHAVAGEQIIEEAVQRWDTPGNPIPNNLPPMGPIDRNDPARRCELADGTPIHPAWLPGLLADAHIRRLGLQDQTVTDLSKIVNAEPTIDHGIINGPRLAELIAQAPSVKLETPVRTYPRHLAQAQMAANRGCCQHPGCTASIHWLQVDHVIPHSHHGPTALWNAQMLCSWHNHRKRDHMPEPFPRLTSHQSTNAA